MKGLAPLCDRLLLAKLGAVLLALAFTASCAKSVDLGGSAGDGGVDAFLADRLVVPVCPGYAAPDTSANCSACNPKDKDCQPNGCFNGYLCLVAQHDCRPPSGTCDAGEDGPSAD